MGNSKLSALERVNRYMILKEFQHRIQDRMRKGIEEMEVLKLYTRDDLESLIREELKNSEYFSNLIDSFSFLRFDEIKGKLVHRSDGTNKVEELFESEVEFVMKDGFREYFSFNQTLESEVK